MAFILPDLPYAHDALAALGMSKETLEFHHDLHHKAYVDNGNKLIAGTEWESKSLDDIVKGTYQAGAVAQNGIFNNASQHWNHNLFWQVMGPGGKAMPGNLDKALIEAFGSVAKFKEDFAAAGAGQFVAVVDISLVVDVVVKFERFARHAKRGQRIMGIGQIGKGKGHGFLLLRQRCGLSLPLARQGQGRAPRIQSIGLPWRRMPPGKTPTRYPGWQVPRAEKELLKPIGFASTLNADPSVNRTAR